MSVHNDGRSLLSPYYYSLENGQDRFVIKADDVDHAPKELLDMKVHEFAFGFWGATTIVTGMINLALLCTVVLMPLIVVTAPVFFVAAGINYRQKHRKYVVIHLNKKSEDITKWDKLREFLIIPNSESVCVDKKDFDKKITALGGTGNLDSYRFLKTNALARLAHKNIERLPDMDDQKRKKLEGRFRWHSEKKRSRMGLERPENPTTDSHYECFIKMGRKITHEVRNEDGQLVKNCTLVGLLALESQKIGEGNDEKKAELLSQIKHLTEHYKESAYGVVLEKVGNESLDVKYRAYDFEFSTGKLVEDGIYKRHAVTGAFVKES